MAKFLKQSEYDSLKTKADNFDAVVNAIVQANEGIAAEEVTPQMIVDAINETKVDTSTQEQLDTANARIAELETINKNLRGSAAEEVQGITPKDEAGAEALSLADFGKENAGDTKVILDKLQNEGLI